MARVVDILKEVEDFDGLISWLNLGSRDVTLFIEKPCKDPQRGPIFECRYRTLVDMYCRGRDLNRTLQDFAEALKRMGKKAQADDLLMIARK